MTHRTDESLATIAAELRRMNKLIALSITATMLTASLDDEEFNSIGKDIDEIMED